MKKCIKRNTVFSSDSNCKYKVLKLSTGVVSALVALSFLNQHEVVSAEEILPSIQDENTLTSTNEEENVMTSEENIEVSEINKEISNESFEATLSDNNNVYEGVITSDEEDVQVNLIAEGERETNFNRNWRVSNGDVDNGENTELDVSNWRLIDLPNDFSIDKEISTRYEAESGFYPGGTQWYRKNFVLPQEHIDKELSLTFDGSYMVTEVYVNGNKVGEHKNGYSPFNVNLTDYLHKDGATENQIALRVTNELPSSRWYSGSGIYRDVTLVVTDKVHITHNGVTITTPDLATQAQGDVTVNISANVENKTESDQLLSVVNQLINADGIKVAESQAVTALLQSGTGQAVNTSLTVNTPTLWDLNNPYLYKVKTLVSVDGQLKDSYESDFGFRYFNFDRNTGFSLNGQNVKLKGVNNHHDNGALGAVANKDAIKRQLELLKEMGANSIRTSHNPTSRALLDEANRQGFLIVEEAFDGWDHQKNSNSKDFARFFNEKLGEENAKNLANAHEDMTWAEYSLKSMINRGKNDPSIIMWSIGNEIDEGLSYGVHASHFGEVAKKIVNWIKEADPTRPATIGNNRLDSLDVVNQVVADAGGIVGYNYKNAHDMKRKLDNNPNWILYGSETTSAIHSRGEYGTLGQDNHKLQMSEYDNQYARVGWGSSASQAWKQAIENDWNAGIYVWTGFDYIGEPTPWIKTTPGSYTGRGAVPNSSYFGILDTAGFPKDTYWLYRSMWKDDDYTLSLMSTWNDEEIVKQNGKVQVDVFTNAHRVELYLNDQKIGERSSTKTVTEAGHTYRRFEGSDNPYPTFMVDWQEGTLSVKAFDEEGNEITDQAKGRKSVSTTYEPTALRTTTKDTIINADGSSLAYIEVDVLDHNGNIVNGSYNNIQFEIEGPGKIVGVDNGNAADGSSYKVNNRDAFHGKALVIVQSDREPGTITLRANSDGLTSATQIIQVERQATNESVFLESVRMAKNYTLTTGQNLLLPESVSAFYSNGEIENKSVVWDSLTAEQLATPGSYQVKGLIEGQTTPIIANVTVIQPIVAVENYSTETTKGVNPQLPKLLMSYDQQANQVIEVPVNWDLENHEFTAEGKMAILGKASVFGQAVNVKALVDVLPEAEQTINLTRLNDDLPVFKNGYRIGDTITELDRAISDTLNRLNNGVSNNGNDVNERWTNWSLRERSDIEEFFVEVNWQENQTFDNINLWHFTDYFSQVPGNTNIRFEYWDEESQTWKAQQASNITQVSYIEGATPYGFANPMTTNRLRIWMKQAAPGKSLGLTEVEVWSHVEPVVKRSVAEIDSITIGNEKITFEQNNHFEYHSSDALPITISTRENGSATLVPLGNQRYQVIVKSEDGTQTKVYTLINTYSTDVVTNEWTKLANKHSWEFTDNNGKVTKSLTSEGLIVEGVKQYDTIVTIGEDEYYVKPEKYAGKLTLNQWAYSPTMDTWFKTDATGKIIEKADATGYYVNGVQQFDVVKTIGNGTGFQVYYKPEKYAGKITKNQWAYSPSEDTWYKTDRSGKIVELASKQGYFVNGHQQFNTIARVGNGRGQQFFYQADGTALINARVQNPRDGKWYQTNELGVVVNISLI